MNHRELLYAHDSLFITVTLFLVILAIYEVGFRFGRFVQAGTAHEVKELTGSVQASVLGILALLLGFTFSMSLQRYDDRSHALIDEANAIGTVSLRAELLPEAHRAGAIRLLRSLIDLRVETGKLELPDREQRHELNRRMSDIQNALWSTAVAAANEDPRPTTTGAFVAALTAMIDSQGKRQALLRLHVPEVILLLLFLVFVSSGGFLGYSSGLRGQRIIAPMTVVSFLIALVVFIIIDLDRPKRGLIKVDQSPLVELLQEDSR